MKIIDSNKNIEWRKLLSGRDELKTIIKFEVIKSNLKFK